MRAEVSEMRSSQDRLSAESRSYVIEADVSEALMKPATKAFETCGLGIFHGLHEVGNAP